MPLNADGIGIHKDVIRNKSAYVMAVSASWGGMMFGWTLGMIGGILPRQAFKRSFGIGDDPIASADIVGWIVVINQLGCFVGALMTAVLSDRCGRKKTLLLGGAIYVVGSTLQVTPTIFYTDAPKAALAYLNLTRAIAGIGVGLVCPVVPTYISESSPKHIRGRLTGMYQLFLVFGIASSFWVNYGLFELYGDDPPKEALWQIAFGIQAIPGVLLLYSMSYQHESPRWLAEQGRLDDMRHVLAKLRGATENDPEGATEAYAIKKDVQSRTKLTLGEQAKEAGSSKRMLYRCSIPMIVMAFGQLTGINAMNYYSPTVFRQLGLSETAAGLFGTGIYGVVKIVVTIVALAMGVEQYGRKALLVWGGLGQATCMIFIGIYVLLHPHGEWDLMSYLAIASLYLYITFFSLGWSVASWAVMTECVPNHLRSLTMALGMVSMWSTTILVSKLTPIFLNKISWGTYFIFGVATLVAVLWAILLYPETGGYAIEDIHGLFEDVVKQSLHDNRYLLRRPPVRRGYTHLRENGEADSDGFELTRASFDSATTVDRLL